MLNKTEREKMLGGELYLATDEELTGMHQAAKKLIHQLNFSKPEDLNSRIQITKRLFGRTR